MKRLSAFAAVLISLAAVSAQAEAFSYSRTLTAPGNWFTSGAWTLNGNSATWSNPGSGNTASAAITTSGTTPLTLVLDQAVILNGVSLDGTADLTLTGSALTVQSPSSLNLGGRKLTILPDVTITTQNKGALWDSSGTLELRGNNTISGSDVALALKAGTLLISSGSTAISGGNLIFTGSGARLELEGEAELTITSLLARGGSYNTGTGEKGAIYVRDNASLIASGNVLLGASNGSYGDGSNNTQIDIFQSGGLVEFRGGEVRISHDTSAGASSTYNLSGGTFSVPNANLDIGRSGPGILTTTGGSLIARGLYICRNTGQGAASTRPSSAVLNGGTLTLGSTGITTDNATNASLELGAATLTSSANWSLRSITNASLTDLETGTTFAPAAEQTITLSTPLFGPGKLVAGGEGTLIMGADNTYTGGTEITSGTVRYTTASQLPSTGTLTLSGGLLDMGGDSTLTFTPANIALNGGTLAMTLNSGDGPSDILTTGTLTLGEADVTFDVTFTSIPPASYPLIIASEITGNTTDLSNLKVSPHFQVPGDSLTYTFRIAQEGAAKILYLDVTAAGSGKNLIWQAAEGGQWSVSPVDTPWKDLATGTASAFSPDDTVYFGDIEETEAIAVTVDGALAVEETVFFFNPATTYTFSGSAGASLTMPLLNFAVPGASATFNLPVIPDVIAMEPNTALTFNDTLGTTAGGSDALYAPDLTLPSGAAFTVNPPADATQELSGAVTLTGGALGNIGEGTLKLTGNLTGNQPSLSWNTPGTLEITGSENSITAEREKDGILVVNEGTVRFSSGVTTLSSTVSGGYGLTIKSSTGRIIFENDAEVTINGQETSFTTQAASYDSETGEKGAYILRDNAKVNVNSGIFYLGASGGAAAGDFIQEGGELTLASGVIFRTGWNAGGTGNGESVYNLSGGRFLAPGTMLNVGRQGDARLKVTGGELFANGITLAYDAVATSNSNGLGELTGGTLTLGSGGLTTGRPTMSALTLGAATFKTAESASWTLSSFTDALLTDATDGTTFAPTAGRSITLSASLAGEGKLVVDGEGEVVISATQTYTGGTEVKGGTLTYTSAGQTQSGAAITVSGGKLNLGGSAPVAMAVQNLTFNGGALGMRFSTVTGNDTLNVNSLGLGTAETVFEITFNTIPEGEYPLITAQNITGNTSNLRIVPRLPVENDTIDYSFRITGNTLFLDVSVNSRNLTWTSAAGNWSAATADTNWKDENNTATFFAQGDAVAFGDLAGVNNAAVTVTETVLSKNVVLNNTASRYTFTSAEEAALSATAFTAETGAVATFDLPFAADRISFGENTTLAFTDSFSVISPFTVSAGSALAFAESLQMPQAISLPANSSLTLGGSLGNNAAANTINQALTFASGSAITFEPEAPIAQTVGVNMTGPGEISIKGEGSTLTLSTSQSNFTGKINVTDGAKLRLTGGAGSVGVFNNSVWTTQTPIYAANGGVIELAQNNTTGWNAGKGYNFAELGEGGIIRLVSTNSGEGFWKIITLSGSAIIENTYTSGDYRFKGGTRFNATAGDSVIQGIAGTPSMKLYNGNNAADRTTFDIAEGASIRVTAAFAPNSSTVTQNGIRKEGSGTLIFEGLVDHYLPTEIYGGTLILNTVATNSHATLTSTYTIGNGSAFACLAGSGTIDPTPVTVRNAAAIETGLTVKTLNLETGSIVRLNTDLSSLTVTTLTGSGTAMVDATVVDSSAYTKDVCTVMTWEGTTPALSYTLTPESPMDLRLVIEGNALLLQKKPGTAIILY